MPSFIQLALQELLGVDLIMGRLERVLEVATKMSSDVATLDAALTAFASDLETALAAIQQKLDALVVPLDLSTEVAMIQTAQARLDAFVSDNTAAAPAEPPAEPPASGVTTGVFENTTATTGTTENTTDATGDAETPGEAA